MDLVGTILYLGAAVLALLAWLWKRWKTRGHSHWPLAEGTVESQRAEERRHGVTWFVVYSYSANGEYYSGEFVAQLPGMRAMFGSRDTTEDAVKASYPLRARFPLRYNPSDPQWSVPVSRKPLAAAFTAHG